jgi:hypothetical protein
MKEETICPACEKNISVECDSSKGSPPTWSYYGGDPGEPAWFVVDSEECEECGHTFTKKELEVMAEDILAHLSDL